MTTYEILHLIVSICMLIISYLMYKLNKNKILVIKFVKNKKKRRNKKKK